MPVLVQIQCVEFDPANQDHRKYYQEFLKSGRWSKGTPRFNLQRPYLSIPSMIVDVLMNYYLTKEFDSKPATTSAATRRNVVNMSKKV